MNPTLAAALVASLSSLCTLGGSARAQATPPLNSIAIGAKVTLGRPSDSEAVLQRLNGAECVAASKLTRNADGSYSAGDVYPGINTTECLRWPTPALKQKGGDNAWASHYPADGDIGQVIGTSRHCDTGLDVVILSIGSYIVPIGLHGVARAVTPGAP